MSKYKVLSKELRIPCIVEEINTELHVHVSGKPFTEEQLKGKKIAKKKKSSSKK